MLPSRRPASTGVAVRCRDGEFEFGCELFRVLIARGATGLPAGDIAQALSVPSSTLLFHLSALERAGLVQATRQRRHMVYAARIARMRSVVVFLTEACCGGQPSLCGDPR